MLCCWSPGGDKSMRMLRGQKICGMQILKCHATKMSEWAIFLSGTALTFSFWENIVNMYDLFAAGMTPFEAFFGSSSSSPELSMSLNNIQQQAHKNSKKYEEAMVITNLAKNPPATYQVGDRVNIRVKSKAARLKSNAKRLLQPRSEEATVIICKHAIVTSTRCKCWDSYMQLYITCYFICNWQEVWYILNV